MPAVARQAHRLPFTSMATIGTETLAAPESLVDSAQSVRADIDHAITALACLVAAHDNRIFLDHGWEGNGDDYLREWQAYLTIDNTQIEDLVVARMILHRNMRDLIHHSTASAAP